jgi:hypothetical protein
MAKTRQVKQFESDIRGALDFIDKANDKKLHPNLHSTLSKTGYTWSVSYDKKGKEGKQ